MDKLVTQGICMNYVIQVNDTDFPRELIEKNWTHEFSGIEYENGCTVCDACIESEQNRIPKSRKKIVKKTKR